MTNREQSKESLQDQIAESLQEVAAILNTSLDQKIVLAKIIEQLQRFVHYDSAVILLRDGEDLVISDLIGLPNPQARGYRIPLTSNSPAVRAFNRQEPLYIANVQADLGWVALAGSKPIRSWLGIPLLSRHGVIGVLTVNSIKEDAYSQADLRLVTTFANQASIAIENARLYATAQEAREAAERASRAKSIFLANMSHELRTPLNAIIGFAQLMARSQNLSPEHRENVRIISRSGEHLLALINQVLDLSKIEAGRLTLDETQFDLDYLLDNLQGMFALKAAEKRVQFLLERDEAVPRLVRADEIKLRQVLINLLSNALKFTEEGGVTLIVKRRDHKGEGQGQETDIAASAPSIWLHFAVSDTGPGIAPDEMGNLFEAFAQTQTGRQAAEGTGLGLPISRKFVQLMGGELQVESRLGQGTTFSFDLPVEVAQTGPGHPSKAKSQKRVVALSPNQPRYRVLIVDDDPISRQLLLKLLTEIGPPPLGFDLREAENGQQALEEWDRFDPDLIWMDMRMPVLNGDEATRQIRATSKGHKTIIIALTASSFEEERVAILAAGCDDFLRKPFREADLFEMMGRYLGVNYIYETAGQAEADQDDQPISTLGALKSGLNRLPAELLGQFRAGLELGDMMMIGTAIAEIQIHQPGLATELTELADKIEYDRILNLIQEIEARDP